MHLYDYRNRMYQPQLGRFLQPNPKQFAAGDYNLYRYCHNDPINKTDPTGLIPLDTIWDIGNLIYDAATGNWDDFKLDLVATAIPYVPAGSSKLIKAIGGTYKLKNAEQAVKRTGKTNSLERRSKEHARNEKTKKLEFETDRKSNNPDARTGREQQIYDQHPEAKAANGGLNQRKPIADDNPKKQDYLDAAERERKLHDR